MGDANPIRTLRDYAKPSHEGYMNTIELPVGNNVVPLRFDTIRLVQNRCSFHRLRFKDPNQHLKEFLILVVSLDLDGENRERMRMRLFQFSLHDQASNWLERLPAGTITTWEDVTTRESLSEAWTRFKDLLQKVPHHGINLWLKVHIYYDHVTPATRRTIDQSDGGKVYDRNAKESWALLEDLTLYDNEILNDPRDFAKPVKAISLPQDVSIPTNSLLAMEHPEKAFVDNCILAALTKRRLNAGALPSDTEAFHFQKSLLQTKMGIGTEQTEEPKSTLEDEFQDVLVFRRMDKPPKDGDGAWHAKIRIIDPDGEEFTKTLQSIPTTRKLSERESPREIINLDHFYDT
ncbi:hypothetical protein Tco_1115563 [Tanacetum coccineum]